MGRGSNGKTEAWVILEAKPDSRIYAGLKSGVDRRSLKRHLDAGTVEECLHSFPARRAIASSFPPERCTPGRGHPARRDSTVQAT